MNRPGLTQRDAVRRKRLCCGEVPRGDACSLRRSRSTPGRAKVGRVTLGARSVRHQGTDSCGPFSATRRLARPFRREGRGDHGGRGCASSFRGQGPASRPASCCRKHDGLSGVDAAFAVRQGGDSCRTCNPNDGGRAPVHRAARCRRSRRAHASDGGLPHERGPRAVELSGARAHLRDCPPRDLGGDAGRRGVDLSPDFLDELKIHRAKASTIDPDALVFPTTRATKRDRSNVARDVLRPGHQSSQQEACRG
jgi:hypothetical protein